MYVLKERKPGEIRSRREKVFQRDGFKCLKCGSEENLTLDHIKPLCMGGKNKSKNLQTLCASCNQEKGTKTINYRRTGQ